MACAGFKFNFNILLTDIIGVNQVGLECGRQSSVCSCLFSRLNYSLVQIVFGVVLQEYIGGHVINKLNMICCI